ncbi:MAG: tyrosine-type recombinase/integrase, partial [Planctomycetota bacterium]|nr:tyrosine-type recombinase/integrase [Planctomycetota bacterium]
MAKWLLSRPERVYARLEKSGWVGPRPDAVAVTLGNLLTAFFAAVSVKPASLVRMQQVEAALLAHFGATRDVSTLADCDAQAWRAELKSQEYAGATISRTVLYARQIFTWAMRHNLVKHNPFAFVKAGSQVNTARSCFVDQATIAKVIDAAPDAEWRLLIALSRYGGLRVPSEALALRWSDVDWANSRMTVRSSKTEHHEGGGVRLVPIFSELLPFLREVFEGAAAGAVYVITQYRQGCNLNPHFRRIIARAGLKPWERTWHNLRASRQTELATNYPLHTACSWIGNTKAIAAGHYLQVTDADWTRATRDAAAGQKTGGAESGATAAEMVVQKVVQHSVAPDGARMLEAGQSPANTEVGRSNATQRVA